MKNDGVVDEYERGVLAIRVDSHSRVDLKKTNRIEQKIKKKDDGNPCRNRLEGK